MKKISTFLFFMLLVCLSLLFLNSCADILDQTLAVSTSDDNTDSKCHHHHRPTKTRTKAPTATPIVIPTATPIVIPTATPTVVPTATPTIEPTVTPTPEPTKEPVTALEVKVAVNIPGMSVDAEHLITVTLVDANDSFSPVSETLNITGNPGIVTFKNPPASCGVLAVYDCYANGISPETIFMASGAFEFYNNLSLNEIITGMLPDSITIPRATTQQLTITLEERNIVKLDF